MRWTLIFILLTSLVVPIIQAQGNPPVANAGEDITTIRDKLTVFDAILSFDLDNNIDDNSFSWYDGELLLGKGKVIQRSFPREGKFFMTLKVTDSSGLSSVDNIRVEVREKSACKNTNAVYFPEDTKCNDKWPSEEGDLILINSPEYSCNLVEICSEDLDPIIVDSIQCCSGELNDPKKQGACQFAKQNSNGDSKTCQTLFVIKGVGTHAIYMQDYFEAEMCCSGVESLCRNPNNYFTSNPNPISESKINKQDLVCRNTPDNNLPGSWVSDEDMGRNNMALTDVPAHVSLNELSTGTCVDFSFAITTLLRKIGYEKEEVYSVETPAHAFNLVKFPFNRKYTVIDTTGTLADINLGGLPSNYEYCEEMTRCFNDKGQVACPAFNSISSCEHISGSFLQSLERIQFKITGTADDLIDAVIKEAKV